jgi:hypothetical protein
MHDDTTNRRVAMYALSGSVVSFVTSQAAIVPNETHHWMGRQVLLPGDKLYAYSTSALDLYWRVSGYLLG